MPSDNVRFIRPDDNRQGLEIYELTYETISEDLKETLREMVLLMDNPGKVILRVRHPSGIGFMYVNNTDGGTLNIEDYDYKKVKDFSNGKIPTE